MSTIEAPEGIRIGPNDQQDPSDDRLPILDADEWPVNSGVGVMSANEVKTITLEGMPTLRPGATLRIQPMNADQYNQQDLLIMHAWVYDVDIVKVIVRNMANEERDFGNDQWVVQGIRFSN